MPESRQADKQDPTVSATRALIEEAYVLALAGRRDAAMRLIDDGLDRLGKSQAGRSFEELAFARVRLQPLGAPEPTRSEVIDYLNGLAQGAGPDRWRALLDLARISLRLGEEQRAGRQLQAAIAEFKSRQAELRPFGESLAQMLSDEVEALAAPPDAGADEERSVEARLTALLALSRRLVAETDPEKVLRIVLHEACSFVGAERGFVVLVRGDDLELAAAENMDGDPLRQPAFEVSRTLIREVVETGKLRSFARGEFPAKHPATRSLVAIGVHRALGIPIPGTDGPLGVLYLDQRGDSPFVLQDDGKLCELFAAQAASALQNANLHRDTTRALATAEETVRRERMEHERREHYGDIVGESPAMQQVYRQLDMIVPTKESVVILGETGTGKDLAARLIHSRGPHADETFVALNCASLSETLLESELFGYERGAFTGADRTQPGLVEVADGGTLFLDEVGEMSPRMQVDLLRVLQSGELRRLGGRQTIRVSVRIIAATHRDLEAQVSEGKFREDLYYRLNVLTLRLPPLRERTEDIAQLSAVLLDGLVDERPAPKISDPALAKMISYPWPGNVRELENVLRALVALRCDTIGVQDLPERLLRSELVALKGGTLKEAEMQAIQRALEITRGNKLRAARMLGIDRGTLYSKLKTIE
ncbi:MAG: sigma-54-dependent Fis family transcriptional regulator [bacterium]|nr:sigma-54-dependent Fis family transcriptional regulator [bacterium]